MNQEIKEFSDMYFAAALLAYGAVLNKTNRTDPRRQKFSLINAIKRVWVLDLNGEIVKEHLQPSFDDINNYYISGCLLFPSDFVSSIRRIKSEIHNG